MLLFSTGHILFTWYDLHQTVVCCTLSLTELSNKTVDQQSMWSVQPGLMLHWFQDTVQEIYGSHVVFQRATVSLIMAVRSHKHCCQYTHTCIYTCQNSQIYIYNARFLLCLDFCFVLISAFASVAYRCP